MAEVTGFSEPRSHWGRYGVSPERRVCSIRKRITDDGALDLFVDVNPDDERSRKACITIPRAVAREMLTGDPSAKPQFVAKTMLEKLPRNARSCLIMDLMRTHNELCDLEEKS